MLNSGGILLPKYYEEGFRQFAKKEYSFQSIVQQCRKCDYFHGEFYQKGFLVCAMHPYGEEKCPDFKDTREFFEPKKQRYDSIPSRVKIKVTVCSNESLFESKIIWAETFKIPEIGDSLNINIVFENHPKINFNRLKLVTWELYICRNLRSLLTQ